MEARTRDLLFGTGRTDTGLGGTFAPRGWAGAAHDKGTVLSTFKGFGSEGRGRDAFLGVAERVGLITAEQRVAGGPVGTAAEGAGEAVRSLVGGGGGASAAATAVVAGQQHANPVYGGLFAQHLMQTQGFVPPSGAPAGGLFAVVDDAAAATPGEQAAVAAADGASAAITSAADDVAQQVASQEQRLVDSFQRLAQLPDDAKVPTLARAVDATAVAGHGGDAFDVLGHALASRPLDAATSALDESVELALRAAPTVDDAAKSVAPIADDVVRASLPRATAGASATRSLLLGSDALPGLMSFGAGVDDTLRLLARF